MLKRFSKITHVYVKVFFVILFFILFIGVNNLTEKTVTAQNSTARPSINGELHVEGTQLCDENGNAVVLKGISTHGLTWYPEFISEDLFIKLADEWDCNLIRLAAYSSEYAKGNKKETMDVLFENLTVLLEGKMLICETINQYM